MWVLVGGVSWRSWLRLLGLGCVCVDRGRDGECEMFRVGAEVVDPWVREEEVGGRGGKCSCLGWWTGVVDRFGGVGVWWEGCVCRQTEVLE